jgi:hypothetical protein
MLFDINMSAYGVGDSLLHTQHGVGGHGPGSTPYTPIHTGLKDTLDMAHWARVAGELKELGKYVHKYQKRPPWHIQTGGGPVMLK